MILEKDELDQVVIKKYIYIFPVVYLHIRKTTCSTVRTNEMHSRIEIS